MLFQLNLPVATKPSSKIQSRAAEMGDGIGPEKFGVADIRA